MKRYTLFLCCLPMICSAGDQALKIIESDHGVSLAISGMVIVFGGLATISICIALLPKVLDTLKKKPQSAPIKLVPFGRDLSGKLDPGTLTAIAFVLQAEAERASGQNLKVTLDLHPSTWALSSQMRVLPGKIKS